MKLNFPSRLFFSEGRVSGPDYMANFSRGEISVRPASETNSHEIKLAIT